ncbi:MAG: A/G-specific adenine glycosylase [Chloroflexi bacterium]|nr:A/G-specific adenine glycosylase [Chloroflexota bacterium]
MSEFADSIFSWYRQHARVLPWRGHVDPYAVWVSEIMLQQTRVETVIPYFERWMVQFPSVAALAESSEQMVLSAWEGLGYYSRGRNLYRAAKIIMAQFDGQIPREITQLRKLPGIGRYTAAAIASIAFNQDVASLDANLRRVFARVFDVATPADSTLGEETLWSLAQVHLPPGRAGDYSQALMDLGSAICLPKKPLCLVCPLCNMCKSRHDPESRPVLKPKQVVPHRLKLAAIICDDQHVLLSLRPSKGLLGGLWEFPSGVVATDSTQALVGVMAAEYALTIKPVSFFAEIQHAYTHFTLTEFAWRSELLERPTNPALTWIHLSELGKYPMGKVDRAIAQKLAADQA